MANVELATAYVSLIPTMQGVQGKVAEALAPAGAEADKAGKSSGGMFAAGFAGVLGAAAIGVAAAGVAVGGAAVGLYKVGAVFDDVTDTIRVGTGASGAALDGLVAISKSVGASVPTSFEKAGQTVSDLNQRLGLSGSTLNTVAQQYIQAGNILGTDVDISTTTAAFSAFGIEGANVEGAMDSLFKVAQATGVGMNELASTVQTNAVPMQNLGFSFEDTAALAGSLDKAGLNTSQTMASMGKSLVTLAKAGEEPQAAFKRTTGEIGEFIKSGDTAGALNLASKVFGTKGATAFVGALQSGKINLDDLTTSAGLTGDTILGLGQETADAAESWQLIKNRALLALEPMGTAVFNLAGQGLGFLADNMDGVTGRLTDFSEGAAGIIGVLATGDFKGPIFGQEEDSGFVDILFNIREAFQSIAPLVGQVFASIGPVLASLIPQLLQVWQAFSPLQLIFSALQPVLPQIVGLIGTLAASLGGALTGALTALMPTFLQLSTLLSETLAGVFVAVMPAVLQIVGMLAGLFTQLAPVIAQIVGVVGELVIQLVGSLAPIFTQLVSTVMPMIVTIFGAVISAIVPLVTMLAGLLIPIIQALMPVVIIVFGVIANVIGTVMQIVMGIIQVVTGIISGNWSQVWEGILNIFSGIWNTIVAVVGGLSMILFTVISAALGMIFSAVGSVLGSVGSFFADTWNNVIAGVGGFMSRLVQDFLNLPGEIMKALGNIGGWLVDSGKALIQGFIDGISGMVGAIGDAVGGVLGAVADFFPHSPAKKGPFSGRGYTSYSGAALAGDFADGIAGQRARVERAAAGITSAAVLSGSASAGASMAAASGGGLGTGGGVTQIIQPAPGMSEETIGRVAADSLNYQLRMAR